MPKRTAAEMNEGQAAMDRFRKALKTIVAVPKSRVVAHDKPTPKRKPAKRKR